MDVNALHIEYVLYVEMLAIFQSPLNVLIMVALSKPVISLKKGLPYTQFDRFPKRSNYY